MAKCKVCEQEIGQEPQSESVPAIRQFVPPFITKCPECGQLVEPAERPFGAITLLSLAQCVCVLAIMGQVVGVIWLLASDLKVPFWLGVCIAVGVPMTIVFHLAAIRVFAYVDEQIARPRVQSRAGQGRPGAGE